MDRFFADIVLADRPALVVLADDEALHLRAVLRHVKGDRVRVFDGRGYECQATVREAGKKQVELELGPPQFRPRVPAVRTRIAVALPRAGAADDVLKSAVEAGAASIMPLTTERSVHRPERKSAAERLERDRRIALAAMKQCGRNLAPEFGMPVAIGNLACAPGEVGVYGSPADDAVDILALERRFGGFPARVLAVVGPEGGLTAAEESGLRERGFLPVRPAPQILRVETAVVVLLGIFGAVPEDRVAPSS